MNKGTAIVGFLLCFLAGMGLMKGIDGGKGAEIVAEDGNEALVKGNADHSKALIPVTKEDPSWGNPDALVTIVEFSDFQCPFCSRVGPTLKKIKENYKPSQVRIVWKHQPLPFHKQARPAHEASATVMGVAGSVAFWKFHDLAFQNQRALTEDNFKKWAVASGADGAKWEAAYKGKKFAKKVDRDMAVAKKVGANGTPAFRINGVTLAGAQPFEKFKTVIDAQLAEANKLVAGGMKAAEVYPTLLAKNAKAAPAKPKGKEKPKAKDPAEDKTVWKVPVEKDDAIKGDKNAAVTVIVFSDFQCPFCKRVNPTMAKIVQSYGKDVRIVWKDNALPFHPRAKPAAVLTRVAYAKQGDAGFWKAHDAVFESAPKLEDKDLEAIAGKIGIPWAEVKTAIDTKKYEKAIAADMELAQDVNARGTPHFFINGRRLSGAQPFEKFKTIIDQEMVRAKAELAKGTAKDKLYAALIAKGKTPPPPEKKDVGPVPAGAPWKGAANARIVIQEFSDFQCPFCSRVNPTIKQVLANHGNEVKIVWRNLPLPFHKDAPLAAEASLEAHKQKGNDGFWKYHDKMFAGQKDPGVKRPALEKYAQEIGLDMTKFKAALDQRTHKAAVEADAKAANAGGVRGTPGFVVNGYFISGAQPYAKFKKIIGLAKKDLK